MLLALLELFGLLAFVPQAALSAFDLVAYSPIRQCDPFNISFNGGQRPAALPLTLTVVPFNSTPLSFTIPESAWDNTTKSGFYATSLPLPAGVTLMASLDDAAGNGAGLVSEVIQIQPSNDTSCISTKIAVPAPFRLVDSTVSQCTPFTVSLNSSSLANRLSVRAFVPTALSSSLQMVAFHANQAIDTFTYIMSVAQGFQVALLFDDGQGNHQVSDLLSVMGGESSPSKCLSAGSTPSTTQAFAGGVGVQGLSRPATIAIAVASPSVVLAILILGFILIRRERRNRAAIYQDPIELVQNQRQTGELRHSLIGPPVPPQLPGTLAELPNHPAPVDPVYPAKRFMGLHMGSSSSLSKRSTILSPSVFGSGKDRSNEDWDGSIMTFPAVGASMDPLVNLDQILELACQQQAEMEAPHGSPNVPLVAAPPVPPSPAFVSTRPLGQKRGDQEPDVPLTPLGRLSQVSFGRAPSPTPTDGTTAVMASHEGFESQGVKGPLGSPF